MKNMIKLPAIVLGLMLLLTGISQKVVAQDDDVSLQTFYDELSPYGTWIQDSQYGYVWRPDVDQGDFRPYYSNGHWAMTEYGNTWVSDYDWGWGPFHYGRWVTDRYNQWLWIPDTTWGPAWVNWRSGGGNYGWAPLGPSISIGFNIPSFWWVFVPQRNIYSNRFSRYDWNRNRGYIRNTTIINNVYVHNHNTYYTGPRRDEIRRVTNRDVRVYNINRSDRPGRSRISNNTLHMYNPRPDRGTENRNAAPRNIAERGDIARGNNSSRGRDNNTPDRGRIGSGNSGRSDRMERPQSGRDITGSYGRPGRSTENRSSADNRNNNIERPTRERSQLNQQRAQATQQQRDQQAQQRGQRDVQERSQQQMQQRDQRSQEQTQQREQQRQQAQQQRSQRDVQERSQQQMQQREQQRQQVQQQRSQQVQQRQQMEQQRSQQQTQQRSQERQQQMQQRQEMPRAAERVQRMDAPQRSTESRSSGERSGSTGGRASRGGGRG
jgi:hypothetical protein